MAKTNRKFKEAGKLFSDPVLEPPDVDTADDARKREENEKRQANKLKHVAHHDLSHPVNKASGEQGYRSRK